MNNINKLPIELLFKILEYFIKGIYQPNGEEKIKKNTIIIRLVCSFWNKICTDQYFKQKIFYFNGFYHIPFDIKDNFINANNFSLQNSAIFSDELNMYYYKNKIIVNDNFIVKIWNWLENGDIVLIFAEKYIDHIKVLCIDNLLFIITIKTNTSIVFNLDDDINENNYYIFSETEKIQDILTSGSNLFSTLGNSHIKLWKYNNSISDFDKFFIKIDDYLSRISFENNPIKKCFVCDTAISYIDDENHFVIIDILSSQTIYNKNFCYNVFMYDNYFLIIGENCFSLLLLDKVNNSYSIFEVYQQYELIVDEVKWFLVKNNKLIIFNKDLIIYNIESTKNKKIIQFNSLEDNFDEKIYNFYINGLNVYCLTDNKLFIINDIIDNANNMNNVMDYNKIIAYDFVADISLMWNDYIFLSDTHTIKIYIVHPFQIQYHLILIKTITLNGLLKNDDFIKKFYIDNNKIIINTFKNIIIYGK